MGKPATAKSPAHSRRTQAVPVPRGTEAPGGASDVGAGDVPGPDRWGPLFDLGPGAVPPERRAEALASMRAYLEQQAGRFLGYQAEENLHFAQELAWLLDLHVNNIGDPFQAGNFTVNSKAVEQRVLDRFARLWRAKTPHSPEDPDSYWGYVLTMGSTEGNMYALWSARDYLSGKALVVDPATADGPEHARRVMMVQAPAPADSPNAYTPVVFYSEDTHYSFTKATRLVGLPTFGELGNSRYPGECPLPGSAGTWPDEVPSLRGDAGPGTIDVDALEVLVGFFAAKGHPPVVSLNVGTTFKCAYDPVTEVAERLVPLLTRYGLLDRIVEYEAGHSDVRNGFWLHVDGALGAAYLPYLARAQEMGLVPADPAVPRFDFSVPQVSSIVTSGHKWPGALDCSRFGGHRFHAAS